MGFLDKFLAQKKEAAKKPEKAHSGSLKESYIITFRLAGKKPTEKVKFCQAIFGRKEGTGLLNGLGGRKLGNGCVLVPAGSLEKIMDFMIERGVPMQKQKIFLAE